jgi:hypothetical protein
MIATPKTFSTRLRQFAAAPNCAHSPYWLKDIFLPLLTKQDYQYWLRDIFLPPLTKQDYSVS